MVITDVFALTGTFLFWLGSIKKNKMVRGAILNVVQDALTVEEEFVEGAALDTLN